MDGKQKSERTSRAFRTQNQNSDFQSHKFGCGSFVVLVCLFFTKNREKGVIMCAIIRLGAWLVRVFSFNVI
jgi:hypothetical protein